MTVATPPATRPKRPARRWPFWLAVVCVIVLLAVMLALESVYLARRNLAREAAIGWLRARGVEASIDVDRLDLDGFSGRIRIGPAADPEVTVERADVHYRTLGPWNGEPLGVEIGEVRLVKPLAHASFKAGKFSMGSLDRVLDEFRKAPPKPDARQPRIIVEGARLLLTTDYGLADVRGDARLEDGKLLGLTAGLEPTVLRVGDLRATLNGGRLAATTRGDRVKIDARFGADALSFGATKAQGLVVALQGELPYPDLKARRGDGKVVLAAQATADRLTSGAATAQAASLDAGFDGAAKGWIDSLVVNGASRAALRAGVMRAADLTLTDLTAAGAGPAAYDAGHGASLRLASAVTARGAWPALGPVLKADDPTIAGFKRLLGGFDVAAPGVDLAVGRTLAVSLTRPARIAGGGGEAIVSAQAGGPLFDGAGGSAHLAVRGRDLPTIDATVPRYALTTGGATATTTLNVRGSLGPLREAALKTSGRLTLDGGAVAYAASACVPVTLAKMELGANDVDAVAGSLCPVSAPLLTLADGAWRLRAQAKGFSAAAPFLEARVADGAGTLDLGGKGEAFQADMTIASAQAIDTAAQTRFNPVRLSGAVVSRGGNWTGDLAVADLAGHALATARLVHDGAAQRGGLTFDTGTLTFMEGGLQPAELSPLAAPVGAPVVGRARFAGQIGWAGETSSGDGVLTLEDIGFKSPAGAISGLAGRIAFTSLVPLITAPDQQLAVARVAAFVPLTDVTATFDLAADALKLDAAQLTVSGGHLRLEPMSIPFAGGVLEGRLQVEGVQLSGLVKASPFGERVEIDAKLTGSLPFVITPEGVRIIDGKLAAIQPGRISIHREALVGVSAEGGATTTSVPDAPIAAPPAAPTAPPPDTITDFAYQAMEDLAFDQLDVTLNSLPAGRLGALFHIRGRHDPPKRQELRLGLIDLITRRFLQRSLPLPSDTGVNLTLDTSLNLDEVLRDVAAAMAQPSDGSAAVQP